MFILRVESATNAAVYRMFAVSNEANFAMLEVAVLSSFEIDMQEQTMFIGFNGERAYEIVFQPQHMQYDVLEEQVFKWFPQIGTPILYVENNQHVLTITLEDMGEYEAPFPFPVCIGGEGDLNSGQPLEIDLDKINTDIMELLADLSEAPDYGGLFELANELNIVKPWQYIDQGQVIALHLQQLGQTVFVYVMGSDQQEYGVMIFDQGPGFESLNHFLQEEQLDTDYYKILNTLAIYFVNRDELEKEDYETIEQAGWSFRGENNWIQLRSFVTGTLPDIPNVIEVEVMKLIILALLHLTEQMANDLEIPHAEVEQGLFPYFEVDDEGQFSPLKVLEIKRTPVELLIEQDELQVRRYKKQPAQLQKIEFDVFYMDLPIYAVEADRMVFPIVVLGVEVQQGTMLFNDVIQAPKLPFVIQQVFYDSMTALEERPEKVVVTETMQFCIEPVAQLLGIQLEIGEQPLIQEIRRAMY